MSEPKITGGPLEAGAAQLVASNLILRKLITFTLCMVAGAVLVFLAIFTRNPLFLLSMLVHGNIWADSSSCMDFGWDAFNSGHRVYETVFFTGAAKFQYPISSLLLYKFAALLHRTGGRFIHHLVLLSFPAALLLTGEVFLAASPGLDGLSRGQRLVARVCIFTLGLIFYPLVVGAALGQLQTFQVLLWTLLVLLWIRGRQELSGVCLALICALKPQFAVFLLWAALRRHWRFFLPFLVSLLAIQGLSIAVFGWHNEMEYLAVLVYLSRHGEAFFDNQSVNGILQRLTANADPALFDIHGFAPYNRTIYLGTTISSALMLATGLVLPMLRRWRDTALDLLFFGLIATIASPIAWDHHYGYFFAAMIYMMAIFLFRQRRLPWGFQLGFFLFTIPSAVGFVFLRTKFTVLASFELFAGLGILSIIALLAEAGKEPVARANGVNAPSENETPIFMELPKDDVFANGFRNRTILHP